MEAPPIGEAASFSVGAGLAGRSFFLQYISLILIILTCVVGAFARDCLVDTPVKSERTVKKLIKPLKNIGKLHLSGIFRPRESRLDEGVLEGVKEVLLSHDVRAQIQVNLEGEASSGLELSIARSIALLHFFVAAGVPASALNIIAWPEVSAAQADVTLLKVEG